ncbi:MAG: hypothetical protein ACK4RZ_12000 [Paracoccaceae bacterium]
MASALANRLAKLEQRRAVAVPNVLEVRHDETDDEACARFIVQHGHAPSNFIVVPTRATDDELSELEPMWADWQRQLIADARDQRLNERNENAGSEHGLGSNRRRRIAYSGNAAGQPNEGLARRPVQPFVRTRQ